jgi:hypothetical protein
MQPACTHIVGAQVAVRAYLPLDAEVVLVVIRVLSVPVGNVFRLTARGQLEAPAWMPAHGAPPVP